MRSNRLWFLLYILFWPCSILLAQDTLKHKIDDVIISAARTPIQFDNITRNVEVLDSSRLAALPVNAPQDMLQYSTGIDLRQRGVEGVQSDVSIRGGTFEQTLILIDGVKVTDPQTGHHNTNLTITSDNIERIEVLKGQGSNIFGPNAFSGAVNIITRKNYGNSVLLNLTGGSYGYYNTGITLSNSTGGLSNSVTFLKSHSDGYMHNTQFDITTLNYSGSYVFSSGSIGLFAGYNDNDFGANSFYSTRFPDQAEHTKTGNISLRGDWETDAVRLSGNIYWRRNEDEFVLRNYDPEFYKNNHQTDVYGGELLATINSGFGVTSIGGEYIYDEIESNNLGIHNRDNKGIFLEQRNLLWDKLTTNINLFGYDYAGIGFKFWPGLDLGYRFNNKLRAFFTAGRAFRVPSYTELYYNDPVTVGNPDLKHEETTNYEIGIYFSEGAFESNVSLFRKEGTDIIDWVRQESEQPWTVRNIASVNTNGIEAGVSFFPEIAFSDLPVLRIGINYTYLDSDKSVDEFESRYVLDYLRHQVVADISHYLPWEIVTSWYFRYKDRANFEDYFVTDIQLRRAISSFDLFIKATNLFDVEYHEISGVPMPGQWITGGVKYQIQY
jgi:iron complex outermembrane receptor protein